MRRTKALAAVMKLGECMDARLPVRLTWPDRGPCGTVPGGADLSWPTVELEIFAWETARRIVLELRDDDLPIIEPALPERGIGALREMQLLSPVTVATTRSMAERTKAEDRVMNLLTVLGGGADRELDLALLFQYLRREGWSDDRARLTLTKVGWQL